MQSILTVTTPAASYDLTVLPNVKAELGIPARDRTKDPRLRLYIEQASGAIAEHCNRVFARETVSEQFRLGSRYHPGHYDAHRVGELILRRHPVTEITSIIENDVTLVAGTDFETDLASGFVTRLAGTQKSCWAHGKITVVYSAGYQLLGGLPWAIERACIRLVKFYLEQSERDALVRSEEVMGVSRIDYQVHTPGVDGGLPDDVISLLAPHVEVRVG